MWLPPASAVAEIPGALSLGSTIKGAGLELGGDNISFPRLSRLMTGCEICPFAHRQRHRTTHPKAEPGSTRTMYCLALSFHLCGIENRLIHATACHITTGAARQRGGSTAKNSPAKHAREVIDANSIFLTNQSDFTEKGEKVDQ
jgi:hypothetical protein